VEVFLSLNGIIFVILFSGKGFYSCVCICLSADFHYHNFNMCSDINLDPGMNLFLHAFIKDYRDFGPRGTQKNFGGFVLLGL